MKQSILDSAGTGVLDTPKTENPSKPLKVGFVSLGCPKNLVDSEVMMGLLSEAGAQMTTAPDAADVLVVNT
ncbi:MAG TPA: hypothetical protein VFA02_10440, partial [Pseudacidobacterium sp.]|nr:hypothetical protein [Pseudacidobacterium sp.]